MTGTHDWLLVTVSVVIAVVASYTALDLAGRVRASTGRARGAWLGTAALAMGGGIWAMHFVAMLAFSMPGMPVTYDLALTALSLLVPIAVTGIGFVVMLRSDRPVMLLPAGLVMGLGVAAMHYMGMAAMRMPATVSYDRAWVAVSILIAIGAATAALWLAARTAELGRRIAAAGVMGVAVAGMHYTAMQAASFRRSGTIDHAHGAASLTQTSLAIDVAATALLILFLALVAAMFDRRFASMAEREAEALRASERRFRSLYQGTPLPLHSLDEQGRIEQVSDTWLRLTGYDRDDVLGRPLVNFLTEASARQALQKDRPVLLRDGVLTDRDYRIVTRSGDIRDVVASARIERDDTGAFLYVLGGLTDVTDRKRAEDALRQAQKIEAIGHLTGGVAHDFNNLLAVVIGNLDLLSRRVAGDEKAARLVKSAMEGAQRGAALTQRLLSFARRQELRPESVDIPGLVRGLAELLQRTLGPRVRIHTVFPLDLPPAQIDAHQLEMAIVNMAVNARDAMPDGGLLTIAAAEELIDAGAGGLAAGRYLKLSLRDDGIGMDAETLARASEPFFTTKGVGKGTGLGLSMVQGLAAQSGGQLLLESEPGRGTAVHLWVPAAQVMAPAAAAPAEAMAPAPAQPLSIMVVDDDELVLANTIAMLEDLGHAVIGASSGEAALRQLEAAPALDLIVSDQLMPGMTGAQLLRRVKERRPELPMLLVSGYAELAPDEKRLAPLLRKPFTQAELASAIVRLRGDARVVDLAARRGRRS